MPTPREAMLSCKHKVCVAGVDHVSRIHLTVLLLISLRGLTLYKKARDTRTTLILFYGVFVSRLSFRFTDDFPI